MAFEIAAPAEQPKPKPKAEPFSWRLIGIVAAIALLLVAGGTAMLAMRDPEVPPLVRLDAAAAERALKDAGFRSTRTMVIVGNLGQSNGRVILSDPSSGERAPSGSNVKLFIGAPTNLFQCPSGSECVFFVNLPAETQNRMRANMN